MTTHQSATLVALPILGACCPVLSCLLLGACLLLGTSCLPSEVLPSCLLAGRSFLCTLVVERFGSSRFPPRAGKKGAVLEIAFPVAQVVPAGLRPLSTLPSCAFSVPPLGFNLLSCFSPGVPCGHTWVFHGNLCWGTPMGLPLQARVPGVSRLLLTEGPCSLGLLRVPPVPQRSFLVAAVPERLRPLPAPRGFLFLSTSSTQPCSRLAWGII
jgi:hypothetical protein